jgi:predicted acetyltransferase
VVVPGLRYHQSFLGALQEYHREGLHTELQPQLLNSQVKFRQWIEDARDAGIRGEAPVERDRVPHRVYWWVAGEHYLGRARLNLRLNEELTEFGGHVGYDIRPTARGRGHATALLRATLQIARDAGIASALLTCAPDNHASRRVIERNGGVLQDISPAGRLRYWCQTDQPAVP